MEERSEYIRKKPNNLRDAMSLNPKINTSSSFLPNIDQVKLQSMFTIAQ